MATPVILVDGPKATIAAPDGSRVEILEAFARYACKETAGVRLGRVVVNALNRAWGKNQSSVYTILNRQMPLLMVKDKLFSLVDRCGSCNGFGCAQCGHTGFR